LYHTEQILSAEAFLVTLNFGRRKLPRVPNFEHEARPKSSRDAQVSARGSKADSCVERFTRCFNLKILRVNSLTRVTSKQFCRAGELTLKVCFRKRGLFLGRIGPWLLLHKPKARARAGLVFVLSRA
jgi:hypothetical protein